MIDFEYLYQGLCGLANAHRASSMAGHLGAALVAGYFFGEDNADLDDAVYRGVEDELDRIQAGEEAIWFNAKKAGITVAELFEPLPKEEPDESLIGEISKSLAANIGQTRQSGHNVIFAALAIRALRDHPEYATPKMVQGIVKLINRFDGAVPGRGYYGKESGWIVGNKVKLNDKDQPAAYQDRPGMVDVVLGEIVETAAVRKQGFGGLWHIINHTAGLLELERYGFGEVSDKGLAAHRHHVHLWRSLPDVAGELGKVVAAENDPKTAAYWSETLTRNQARLTHRVKTLYGFSAMVRDTKDSKVRQAAEKQLLYLMD